MPPKKRNRDPKVGALDDDEELDKEELKAMLRQSLDEKAELSVERDRLLLDHAFQGMVNGGTPGNKHFYYHNFKVLEQARAAKMEHLLQVTGALHTRRDRCWATARLQYMWVSSCTELLQLFNNGLRAGTRLTSISPDMSPDSPTQSLFHLTVVCPLRASATVPKGKESEYLVLAAESYYTRINPMLAKKLEPEDAAPLQQFGIDSRDWTRKGLTTLRSAELGTLSRNPRRRAFPQDALDKVQGAEFNAIVKGVMIRVKKFPFHNGVTHYIKVDLDFDRMVYVREDGQEVNIGFWDPRDNDSNSESDSDESL